MKLRQTIIAASLAVVCCANAYAITPAYEYTGSSSLYDSRPFTLGFQFTLSSTTAIDALGYVDDGLANSHDVGIWNTSGVLLASVTVSGSDALSGHFRYASISTLTLAAGSYVIGGTYLGNSDPFTYAVSGITTAPNFTWNTDLQRYGSGLLYPTVSTSGGYGQNGIATVNFSTTPVPEPETYALLLGGLGLVGFAARRKARA